MRIYWSLAQTKAKSRLLWIKIIMYHVWMNYWDYLTYKKLSKDPLRQLTSRINGLTKSWKDLGIIDVGTYRLLNCISDNLSRCYGLPKIHKVGFLLRIIVSSLDSPIYKVARFLHEILIQLTNHYHILKMVGPLLTL